MNWNILTLTTFPLLPRKPNFAFHEVSRVQLISGFKIIIYTSFFHGLKRKKLLSHSQQTQQKALAKQSTIQPLKKHMKCYKISNNAFQIIIKVLPSYSKSNKLYIGAWNKTTLCPFIYSLTQPVKPHQWAMLPWKSCKTTPNQSEAAEPAALSARLLPPSSKALQSTPSSLSSPQNPRVKW